MAKVILTAEQVTAIESVKSRIDTVHGGQAQFYYNLVKGDFHFSDEREPLNIMSSIKIMRAILEGYELPELTAEEIVDELMSKANSYSVEPYGPETDKEAYNFGVARAISILRDKGIKFTK